MPSKISVLYISSSLLSYYFCFLLELRAMEPRGAPDRVHFMPVGARFSPGKGTRANLKLRPPI